MDMLWTCYGHAHNYRVLFFVRTHKPAHILRDGKIGSSPYF